MPYPLLIRADAGSTIGMGHAMRCLALAQRKRKSGPVVFAMAQSTPALDERLLRENCELRRISAGRGSIADADATIGIAAELDAGWVVVDGYAFGEDYQHRIHAAGLRQLFFDDYGHSARYSADLVLNPSLAAAPDRYEHRVPNSRLLLGSRYALLRREFLTCEHRRTTNPPTAEKILVTLGGSDPDDVTGRVSEALLQVPGIEAAVIVGSGYRHRVSLESKMRVSGGAIRIVTDPESMPQWMAWADLAITAGGSTSWETAFMGLPSLMLVLADNQFENARQAELSGASLNLGDHRRAESAEIAAAVRELRFDGARRDSMSHAARTLVDGLGCARVAARMDAAFVGLRSAQEADSRTVWAWSNEATVRAASFSGEPIPWDVHIAWFKQRLDDRRSRFYLALSDDEEPIGQVRFKRRDDGDGVVSLSLAPNARGRRLGAAIAVRGAERFFSETDAARIHAYVKPDNGSSIRTFLAADFRDAGPAIIRGRAASHFFLERNRL